MGINQKQNVNCGVASPVTNCATTKAWPTYNGGQNSFDSVRLWDSPPNVVWRGIETSRGVWNFADFDNWMTIAANRGISLLWTGGRTPTSGGITTTANTDASCSYEAGSCHPPSDIDGSCTPNSVTVPNGAGVNHTYTVPNTSTANCITREFYTALVHHIIDWNAAHSASVKVYLECWNEPNTNTWRETISFPTLGDGRLVTMCGDLLKTAHAIDPNAVVVGPSPQGSSSPSWFDTHFLAATNSSGPTSYAGATTMDVLNWHPYISAPSGITNQPESVISQIGSVGTSGTLAFVFNKYGLSAKPIWATEHAWDSGTNSTMYNLSGASCNPASDLSADCQNASAGFLARELLLLLGEGIAQSYWYQYDNSSNGTLWDATNGGHLAYKAYTVVKMWTIGASLTNVPYTTSTVGGQTLYQMDFIRQSTPGYLMRVLWLGVNNKATAVCPATVCTAGFTQFRDLNGNTTPIPVGFAIGQMPVALESLTANPSASAGGASAWGGIVY
jgi:hypothetical protein